MVSRNNGKESDAVAHGHINLAHQIPSALQTPLQHPTTQSHTNTSNDINFEYQRDSNFDFGSTSRIQANIQQPSKMSIIVALILVELYAICISVMATSLVSSVAGNIFKTMEQVACTATIDATLNDTFQLPTVNTTAFDVQLASRPTVIKPRSVRRRIVARKPKCDPLDAILQTPMPGMQCAVM
jgi:hypothetical protein